MAGAGLSTKTSQMLETTAELTLQFLPPVIRGVNPRDDRLLIAGRALNPAAWSKGCRLLMRGSCRPLTSNGGVDRNPVPAFAIPHNSGGGTVFSGFGKNRFSVFPRNVPKFRKHFTTQRPIALLRAPKNAGSRRLRPADRWGGRIFTYNPISILLIKAFAERNPVGKNARSGCRLNRCEVQW